MVLGLLVQWVHASVSKVDSIEWYRQYLLQNNYHEELERFTQLSQSEQETFIQIINNPKLLLDAIWKEYNDGVIKTERSDGWYTISSRSSNSTKYHHKIVDFTTSLFWIDVVIVRAILNYESVGTNVTKINYGSMSVYRNLVPTYNVSIGSVNSYITKNLEVFSFINQGRNYDFAHLNWVLWIGLGLQNIGGVTFFSKYPKIWIGYNDVSLIHYD